MWSNLKKYSWRRLGLTIVMVTILVISIILIVAPASGENQDSASEAEMFSMIRANGDFTPAGSNKVGIEALGDSAEVSVSSATGYASFVRIEAGALHSNLDAGASAVEKADAFLADYGDIFGISDASRELSLASVETTLGGIEHVSYLQNYEGIPVYAGVLRVHFNAAGELFAANGDFVPDISVRTSPALTASEAEAAAVSATALGSSTRAAKVDLTASDAELVIYRTGLVQGISGESYLAYEVEVTDSAGTVREFVFVDAQSGAVLDSFSGIHEDLDREISETSLANVVWDESEGDPEPIPAGWADGTAQQVTDWNNEIDGAKETYNLFMSMASRDSYDGAGATMRTVNNDPNISCPNAQWNGISTNYCTDVTGDDTVAHEWGHAYTEYTNNLIYAWQPGALNESYSDIWGEVVDLLNGRGTDSPGGLRTDGSCSIYGGGSPSNDDSYRWLSGEDDPAFGGAIRDLWNPGCYGDPNSVSDSDYWCSAGDGGGVHTNSGVPNRAFALMVDGNAAEGVTGIGLTKAAHIEWAAQNLLSMASDFVDNADALEAACSALIGVDLPELSTAISTTVPSGEVISAGDCQEVADAVAAVEFRTPPDQCGFEPAWSEAPALCDGQGNGEVLRIDYQDWEAGFAGWVTGTHDIANPDSFDNPDWVIRGQLPMDRSGSAAYVEDSINRGACTPEDTVAGALNLDSPAFEVPAGVSVPRAAIWHYVSTESGWDGGNLKVSVNGGPWTVVPDSAMDFNGYFPPGALNGGGNDNPLGGEEGWTGGGEGSVASGWGQTQVNLSGFAGAGDSVQLRFDMGLDGCNGVDGWYVDEVEIYSCDQEVGGVCGDSILDPGESCDDGNTADGDGCSSVCEVEDGWVCTDPIPPASGSNSVADPSFEAGPFGGVWTENSTNFGTPICDVAGCGTGSGTGPNTGSYWVWFGGIATFEEGSVSQEVTIPSTATDLAFYLEQPVCDSAADYMDVRIDGNIVFNTNGISNLCGNVGYTLQTVDISSYADDTSHTLLFESQVIADNEGVTNFFVDDVSISDNLASDPEPSVCRPLTYDLVCNGEVVDFEGGIPPTWSTENTGNVYWTDTEDTDGCDQPNITPGSGIAACADADHTNGAGDPYEAIMTTNVFNLAEYESAALEFATAYRNLTSEDSFEVQVWDGTAWVTELSWNDDHYDPGEIVSLDLSDYDGFTMARFVYSGPGWDWFVQVDDVSLVCGNPIIDAAPSSFDVEMQANEQYTDTLSIGNVGAADLVWTVLEEAAAPRSQLPERAPVADLATSNSGASSGGLRGVSPDGLLWDQTDNPSDNGAPSQYFLDFDGFGISADDFMVPEPGWAITRVVALGSYRDVNSAPDWDVDIYLDMGDSPGPLVFSDAGVAAFTDVDGDVIIDLTTPAELPAGRYWISVVANLAFNGADQWFWTARTVQNGEPYHWTENGLFGTPCNGVWAPGASVCGVGGGVDPDLLFALYGVEEVVESCIPSDIPWVSVSPTDGTTAAGESDDVVVTFDSTGLEVGTYYGDLCVQSNDPETPLVGIPLTLTIPQEPTGVSVSVFGDGSSFSMTPVWLAALVSVSLLGTALVLRRRRAQ